MVEAIANSIEDVLVDGLSFKLKKGASYINERKSVTYHPQGSNIYSTNGTKLIKLLVTADAWLDPSTFRVAFDLVNMDDDPNKKLRPISAPHSFFKRMRILCNGNIVEDIDDFARCSEMFLNLMPPDSKKNVYTEGFGDFFNLDDFINGKLTSVTYPGIAGKQSQTVMFAPLSGLLQQPKYIPLKYCPLTIELELINDPLEPIISKLGTALGDFTETNTSTKWQIQNVQVKCDICTLDNSLDNSYTEHLLSGKALPINYNTYVSQTQTIKSGTNEGQKSVRLNITRALSRLKSVFVTLDKEIAGENAKVGFKKFNDFYSPMSADTIAGKNNYNSNNEFEFQLQLGSKLFPEYPVRSHSEAFYQLRKTMAQFNNLHSLDISSMEYRRNKFILAIDMERVLTASFTGMNTRAGDILNVRFDHKGATSTYAHEMHVILQSDNIMEVRDGGITIFD